MLAKAAGLRCGRLRPAALTCDFRSARSRAEAAPSLSASGSPPPGKGCELPTSSTSSSPQAQPIAQSVCARLRTVSGRSILRGRQPAEDSHERTRAAGLRCGRLRPAALTCDFRSARSRAEAAPSLSASGSPPPGKGCELPTSSTSSSPQAQPIAQSVCARLRTVSGRSILRGRQPAEDSHERTRAAGLRVRRLRPADPSREIDNHAHPFLLKHNSRCGPPTSGEVAPHKADGRPQADRKAPSIRRRRPGAKPRCTRDYRA